MRRLNNPDQVRQQYSSSRNLEARIAIHERFSTHQEDWHRWMWERFNIPARARVLELGCGTGLLWSKNRERIPADVEITLCDLSLGMLAVTQKLHLPARLAQCDAQDIPFCEATFDVAFANHMLYHIPDLDKALSEIRRVLKPNGRLYAATNGLNHMHEVDELIRGHFPIEDPRFVLPFSKESGQATLHRHFETVRLYEVPDGLRVTEAEPLVAYVLSGPLAEFGDDAKRVERLRGAIEERIARDGAIYISKSPCLFEASDA